MDRIHVMELVRSYQVGELTRREFLVKGGAAVGSMAAAGALLAACAEFPNEAPPPIVDQAAPATPPTAATPGFFAGTVSYDGPGGQTLSGYLAYSEEGPPKPAVVVIQEWWGLNEHIRDVARRFAAEGFAALAPDLYHGAVTTEPDEARKLAMELDTPAAVAEIEAAIAFLQGQPFVASPRVGVVGFCMGGGLVLQTALASEGMGAGVVFYGRPLSPAQAPGVRAPILTFIGTRDSIPVSGVEAMHAAFETAGLTHELQIIDGAQHAFFNDTRTGSYDAAAAADAWTRTLAWFKRHLILTGS